MLKPILLFLCCLLAFTSARANTNTQPAEHVYTSVADGSTQPYWVYLPADYSPNKKYPLAVFLHGYDPAITKINPWIPGENIWSVFTNAGFILAIPYGRRNTDFVDIGEDDVMRVRREVMHHYSVNPQRVFLVGVSMGAYGAYAVSLHHPDKWRGVAAISGRTDFYLWFSLNRAKLPDWKKVLFDANDPRHLALNALHLPIFIQQGAQDTIDSPEQSRHFVQDLKQLNYTVLYKEYPYAGHYMYFANSPYQQIVNWLRSIPTRQGPPSQVRFATGTLRDATVNWVQITGFKTYNQLASIDAKITNNNTIQVTTSNIASFILTPPKVLFHANKKIQVNLNGKLLPQKYEAEQQIFYPQKQSPQSFPGYKTAHRSGPVKACFRDPFLVVYGTGNPADEFKARLFASQWQQYADGMPPVKADVEVTAQDKQNYNLILFGTPASNTVLKNIAPQLPIHYAADHYILGKKYFSAKGTGVIFCYPSPFSTKRMIVVQSGLYWGAGLPINHKWDLIPDYIVYNSTTTGGPSRRKADKVNQALTAGFFDHHWQLN